MISERMADVLLLDGGLSTWISDVSGGPLHRTMWSAAMLVDDFGCNLVDRATRFVRQTLVINNHSKQELLLLSL